MFEVLEHLPYIGKMMQHTRIKCQDCYPVAIWLSFYSVSVTIVYCDHCLFVWLDALNPSQQLWLCRDSQFT